MKKILCLIDGLGSGGAQRQLVGLADLLKRKGYNVKLVWYHKADFFRNYLEEHNVQYEQLSASNVLTKAFKLVNIIIKNEPDVIVAYMGGPTRLACCLKMFRIKSKIIVSERNLTQSIHFKERVKFFMYRWADYIVSNSQAQTNFINKHFKKLRSKTITIRNFVNSNYFVPSHKQISHTGKRKFLVVGRIAQQKNIIAFMQAVRKALDLGVSFEVDWYGRVSANQEEYNEKVLQIYDKLQLQNCLHFHQHTQNVLKKYQECDVFCLPSLYEGFPNVICEAMSCGKPILCSNVADNAFLVHEGKNGILFNPTVVDDMAEKIILFCSKTGKELETMGEESRKIVMNNLAEENFVQQYIEIIEQ